MSNNFAYACILILCITSTSTAEPHVSEANDLKYLLENANKERLERAKDLVKMAETGDAIFQDLLGFLPRMCAYKDLYATEIDNANNLNNKIEATGDYIKSLEALLAKIQNIQRTDSRGANPYILARINYELAVGRCKYLSYKLEKH
jgi:hypothetical protein